MRGDAGAELDDGFFRERDKLAAADPMFDAVAFSDAIRAAVCSGALSAEGAAGELPNMLTSILPGAPEAGRALLAELAQTYDPLAMQNMAVCLLEGHGGPVDAKEACRLLEAVLQQPATPDDALATANAMLGACFRDGNGVAQNLAAAVSLFEEAARLGNPVGAFEAGVAWQGERDRPEKLPGAPDYEKAAQYYAMAPRDHRCGTNLGLLHLRGCLANPSITKGVALLRESAAQGDKVALYNLRHYRALGQQCSDALEALRVE